LLDFLYTQLTMSKNIAVKTIDDNTILVGPNKTTWIEPNTISVVVIGDQSDALANVQQKVCKEMAGRVNDKINYLIDLNGAGKSSHHARKTWQMLSESKKTYKVAVFGMHPVARVLAAFVMGASSKKEMSFFKTREEAVLWLET